MSTPSARTGGSLDAWFKISQRGSTVRQEVVAGLTTFLAMVYSVIVVPGMLGKAGFPPAAVFVATCLVAGLGSIVMGLWANLPLAIGCAISLTAFTAFSLVLGQHISVPVALGAVFLWVCCLRSFLPRVSVAGFCATCRTVWRTARGSVSVCSCC